MRFPSSEVNGAARAEPGQSEDQQKVGRLMYRLEKPTAVPRLRTAVLARPTTALLPQKGRTGPEGPVSC